MPQLNQLARDCVVYLYASTEDAGTGTHYGGSGFLAYLHTTPNLDAHLYAITNRHVIEAGYPIIRGIKFSRVSVVLPQSVKDWIFHPDGDDLAICPIGRWRESNFVGIPVDRFITQTTMKDHELRFGADVYMAGRFIGLDGKQRNDPCVRFGNISMMPQFIERPGLTAQESFVIEMRSKAGFSGAPVFVYFDKPTSDEEEALTFLLGVDWADIPLYEDIVRLDAGGKEYPKQLKAKVNSGMTAVIPAWRISQLLNDPELVDQRRIADHRIVKQTGPHIPGARGLLG